MRKLICLFAISVFSLSAHAGEDIYDPSTNHLTIPSITVNGVIYRDVVVTIGKVLSIGSSSKVEVNASLDRTCSWNKEPSSDYDTHALNYNIVVHPSSGIIDVKVTGIINRSRFYPSLMNLVQGSKSTEITNYSFSPGVLWAGDDGFVDGTIPAGVTKSGELSRFPSWLDLNEQFTWIDADGNQYSC